MTRSRKAFLHSLLALLLSISMLIGSTFAWFTDSVTTGSNVITTGTLGLEMYWTDDLQSGTWYNVEDPATNKVFNYDNWEPGYTEVRYLKLKNTGNLALNYQLLMTPVGAVGKLAEVIQVYYDKEGAAVNERGDLSGMAALGFLDRVMERAVTGNGTILAQDQVGLHPAGETVVTLAMQMVETAGNDYQDKSVGDGFTITALATQATYEEDSTGADYDADAKYLYPDGRDVASAPVTAQGGVTTAPVTLAGDTVTATVPAGVKLEDGAEELTLTVRPLDDTTSGITTVNDENLIPVDVHVEGVAADNTTPIVIDLGPVLPVGLNMGNYTLYHVEKEGIALMTYVASAAALTAHNTFTYDPATGQVSVALATFSEVALIAEEDAAWEGTVATAFAGGDGSAADPYRIANADQLAYMNKLVSNDPAYNLSGDDYGSKHYKLLSNVNLGTAEKDGGATAETVWYPIGYWKPRTTATLSLDGAYGPEAIYLESPDHPLPAFTATVADSAETTYEYGGAFKGTFDGAGFAVSNVYQNTWVMKGSYEGTYWNHAMGLFGYVYGGTVKNLTVKNLSSDGEFTPTGVIAAYAAAGSSSASFKNIAILNCNPRVYNTGNGGIVGVAGNTADGSDKVLSFENITVDNTNVISALWGSWDVACGGIAGMFRGDGKVNMTNCHVSAQIDAYNDVCGNYQYYWYRYSGMLIGSIRKHVVENGYTMPDTSGITTVGCSVHFGEWNQYYYCELVANTLASYTHDHQFSRLTPIGALTEISEDGGQTFKKTGNFLLTDANGSKTCYHIMQNAEGGLYRHFHDVADDTNKEIYETVNGVKQLKENNQIIYLPFNQLFSGYGWGVKHVSLKEFTDKGGNVVEILDGASNVKFTSGFASGFLPRVGNQNAVALGDLFDVVSGQTIVSTGVAVSVSKLSESMSISYTVNYNTADWTKGTIDFDGTGVVKVTIQDYNLCAPTTIYLEVVDAVNATAATNATANNVVLVRDISGGFNVSGRYAVYGNGFTCNYTADGRYLKNGLKQGVITVSGNGTLDNLRVKAGIYPAAYLYYDEVTKSNAYETDPNDSSKVRYFYQLSAVVAKENATISNCYIYGGRNNLFVDTGDVTVKDTVLENGTLANVQIQSNASHTVTFENLTTIQSQVKPTMGDTSLTMLGAGIIVGPETNDNPTIVLEGDLKQYNWVNSDDQSAVSNTTAQAIIEAAVDASAFNHTVDGKTASNLGIIFMNEYATQVENNTGLPYGTENISISVSLVTVKGQVCSLQGASAAQICSDAAAADRTTVNGLYQPQFKYSSDLGGQYMAKTEDGDEYCYREGDTVKVMFPNSETKTLDLATLVSVTKYSGQDLGLTVSCKDAVGAPVALNGTKLTLSTAGEYTVTYSVKDSWFYDKDGKPITKTVPYSWDVTVSVSLKDTALPNAYFDYDAAKQIMGYAKKNFLSGGNTQYLPFLAGLKIYDYTGSETPYLRFDGDTDFNKIAKAEITGYTSANHVLIEVTLTDGGVINVDTTARAASGGSTYTGKLNTAGNVLYYVNDGTTGTTTTTWVISNYTFIGNNGEEVKSGAVTFANCQNGTVPTGSFGTTVTYTVSYDAGEGTCGQTVGYATSANGAVTLPTPRRSGHIFAGWYTAANGGTRVGGAGDSYTPTANGTLYAQWGLPCTVTYNANGGTCGTASAYYDGTALTLPTATRDGYWFIGWYTAANGGTKVGDAGTAYNPTGEITLYAHWQEPIKYTVTYEANGGTCSTTSATYEGTALTLPTPTREGHTFDGWHTAATDGARVGGAGDTYSPTANGTLYARWTVNTYKVTVTTSNATVSGVTNGQEIAYGTTVSVTVSFSKNSSKTFTVTANGTELLNKTAAGTYTFTMPAGDVTINASSKDSCVTADTLVTLADGTQKRIDQVTYADRLLVWDFDRGAYAEAGASIIENHGYSRNEVITLTFADGSVVKAVNVHGFFDADANAWVDINADNAAAMVGRRFAKAHGSTYTATELVSATVTVEYVEAWSILTAGYYNCFLEGLYTVTPPATEQLDFFKTGDGMQYDAAAKQADIDRYGLFTYEEFAHLVTREQFDAFRMAEMKIAIGKGMITYEEILGLLALYA